jgi:hypothetical protein
MVVCQGSVMITFIIISTLTTTQYYLAYRYFTKLQKIFLFGIIYQIGLLFALPLFLLMTEFVCVVPT